MSHWLIVHLLGVVLAIGNMITAAFWKMRADRSGNPEWMHYAARNVMLADYVFTIPGLILIIVSGSVMALQSGIPMTDWNWLGLSLLLLAITGIVWAVVLIPLQLRMIRLSERLKDEGTTDAAYRQASKQWAVFGVAATLLPIVILYLMVSKGF